MFSKLIKKEIDRQMTDVIKKAQDIIEYNLEAKIKWHLMDEVDERMAKNFDRQQDSYDFLNKIAQRIKDIQLK